MKSFICYGRRHILLIGLRKLGKLVFPILLVAFFILGSSLPAHAQQAETATIEVREQTTTVTVSSNFQIDVWITDISAGIFRFDFTVTWDDTQMELVGYQNHVFLNTGVTWVVNVETATSTSYRLVAYYLPDGVGGYTADASWVTLTFHCIAVGSSPINIINVDIDDEFGTDFEVAVVNGVCNQNPRYTPSYSGWVGGTMNTVNKLAVVSPFLALITVAAVATVYVVKSRRKAS
jgi:hypothetical protein